MALPHKEERMLRYEFSKPEIFDLGRELAEANGKKARIESDKKRVVSDFTAQISSAENTIATLSQNISTGYEIRAVVCRVEYNHPSVGRKTIVRSDTHETVEVLEMTDYEMQGSLSL